jgi:titin
VSLAEADPYFTVKLHDKTGVEKDEIILKCEVSKDVPVKWFKDGEEIVPSPKHSVKTDGLRRILKIKKAELKDKGEYVCDCGTDTTKANVTVEGELPPKCETFHLRDCNVCDSVPLTKLRLLLARLIKVEKPLYGVEVFVGETARFEIELSEPDVHGQWKLKGEPLTASPVSQLR